MALDGRKAPILKIVVERFIQTGEPVGSKSVSYTHLDVYERQAENPAVPSRFQYGNAPADSARGRARRARFCRSR